MLKLPEAGGSSHFIHPTTVIEAGRLSRHLGLDVFLVSETFQRTGSFKFRAAYHVAATVAQPRLITASSGNFGQALACACQMLGKRCVVVMPDTSAAVKVEAVREFGGTVDLINTGQKSRQQRVQELAQADPEAYVASPYDDPLVIEGNASLGRELAGISRAFDCVVVPIGGGGLASGVVRGLAGVGRRIDVFGAEPLMANDAARSLRSGRIEVNEGEPLTVADGARTVSLGRHNWLVLRSGLAGIVEVSEEQIRAALQLLFVRANLKVEPTGALGLGAVLAEPERFRGRAVCCVVSGGNVDPEVYGQLLGRCEP